MGLTFGRAEKKVSYGSQKNPHIRISRCKLESGIISVFEHKLDFLERKKSIRFPSPKALCFCERWPPPSARVPTSDVAWGVSVPRQAGGGVQLITLVNTTKHLQCHSEQEASEIH